MKKLIQYFKDAYGELRKVTWPANEELVRVTGIVLGTVFVLSAVFWGLDFLFNEAYKQYASMAVTNKLPAASGSLLDNVQLNTSSGSGIIIK